MPSRRTFLAALGAAGVGAVAGCLGDDRVTGRWPRAGYDDRNSGHTSGVRGPGPNPTVKWTAPIHEGAYTSSPVLRNDRVYVGYGTERYSNGPWRVGLRALDAGTGETQWDATVATFKGGQTIGALYRDSVVYADDALYLVAFDGAYSFTLAGEERWRVPTGGGPTNSILRSGHPVVADGVAYAPTASTTWHTDAPEALYAIDDATGEVSWRYVPPVGENGRGWTFSPALADDVVYLAAFGYGVVALDAGTGAVRWKTGLNASGPPTVADGRVYVSVDSLESSRTSHVVALDATTGEEAWRTTGDGTWLDRRIAAADGRVYHRENLDDVVARDAATGEEVWRYANAAHVYLGTPAVTDDALYVAVVTGGDDTGVAVLHPPTGDLRGFAAIGSDTGLDASVALSDGLAVVTASFGRVYAFESCGFAVAGHCLS